MVLELPPAPAALVLLGLWFADFSARSAAAFLRITVAGPPGGFGDAGRAVVEPAPLLTGDVGRGEDWVEMSALVVTGLRGTKREARGRWQRGRHLSNNPMAS